MRSAILVGAALAVLTVRLLADNGRPETPAPASARAASAAAALLAATVSAPAGAMPAAGMAVPAVPATRADGAASAPALPERVAAARRALHAASVEEAVRVLRRQGAGEDAIYRLRAARLPQADLAQLMASEAAEADWRRQLDACSAGNCEPAQQNRQGHVAAYQRAPLPTLSME